MLAWVWRGLGNRKISTPYFGCVPVGKCSKQDLEVSDEMESELGQRIRRKLKEYDFSDQNEYHYYNNRSGRKSAYDRPSLDGRPSLELPR